MLRVIAWLYTAVVGAAACWAWVTDITMLHDQREHLLPDIVLSFFTMPLSLALGFLYERAESFWNSPLAQLSFLTACGAIQATVLVMLAKRLDRGSHGSPPGGRRAYGIGGFVFGAVAVGLVVKGAVMAGELSPEFAILLTVGGGVGIGLASARWGQAVWRAVAHLLN